MAKNGGNALLNRKQGGDAVRNASRQMANSGAPKTPVQPLTQARKNPVQPLTAPRAGNAPYSSGVAPTSFGGAGTLSSMVSPAGSLATTTSAGPRKWEDLTPEDQTNYLKGDATYTAQSGALEQELQNLIAELGMQRTNYDTDFNSALSNLGWDSKSNQFDPNNLLGAYGASYSNQENDFAGRGMLDSSAYGRALENLGTSFNKQKGDLETAKGNFTRELTQRETGARNTHTQDLQRARADAIARFAAREGIV